VTKWYPIQPAPDPRDVMRGEEDVVEAVNRRVDVELIRKLGYEPL